MARGCGSAECRRESAPRWVHNLWRAMVSVFWRRGSNGYHGRARRHPAHCCHRIHRLRADSLERVRGFGSRDHPTPAFCAHCSGFGHGDLRYSGYRRLCAHGKPDGANAILLALELADLPRDRRRSRARTGATAYLVIGVTSGRPSNLFPTSLKTATKATSPETYAFKSTHLFVAS